jgi:hypothetical protein
LFSGKTLGANAHRASNDIDAMYEILKYSKFWRNRKKVIYKVNLDEGTVASRKIPLRSVPTPNDDSNTDDEDNVSPTMSRNKQSNEEEEDEEEDRTSYGWVKNTGFEGFNSQILFEEAFSRKYNTRNNNTSCKIKPRLQCSITSVNSPIKA